MKIFHLNCGLMKPIGGKLFNQKPAMIVCHCLLIDNSGELTLVDTGVGIEDIKDYSRLGIMHLILNLNKSQKNSAAFQIKALGYKLENVKHIVLTHLDLDHAGGIADFPLANIHVYSKEFYAISKRKGLRNRERYRKCHFEHSPKWIVHSEIPSQLWNGFEQIKNSKLPKNISLILLPGHTKGHCGVLIKNKNKYLLHAGDSYFYSKQIDKKPKCTIGFRIFQYIAHRNIIKAKMYIKKLKELKNQSTNISIFCSHDPDEFESHILE